MTEHQHPARDERLFVLVESNTTGSGRSFCSAARQLGLRPVVLVADPARYRYLAEDAVDFVQTDTADLRALRRAVAELPGGVSGITSSSEYYVGSASELARELGLPHPDPDAIRACRDKAIQRELMQAASVPGPRFAKANTPDQAAAAAERLGFPVVVKPISGSGSVGVRLCGNLPELRSAVLGLLDATPDQLAIPKQSAVLVEQYLAGPEYSVETFDRQLVGITAKQLGPEPHFVETGHDFPASLPAEQARAVGAVTLRALTALGLGWGPAHVELRLTRDGPCLVEVNPRLAGGMIPTLVRQATGIDLIACTIGRAAGRPINLRPDRARFASIRFLLGATAGRLSGSADPTAAAACPGVVAAELLGRPGERFTPRHSFHDRLGYVIGTGDDAVAAASAATAGVTRLGLTVEPVTAGGQLIVEGAGIR
ncbi:MAG TPA: ATP-grasp domain-containing protein [Jatrophihabitans sp.]|nr:ATP-grasp domain-containing protein [Jatrophihabitans sp.]